MKRYQVLWLRHLLTDLSVGSLPSTMVYVDNQAAITMAEHSGYLSRSKHIDLRIIFSVMQWRLVNSRSSLFQAMNNLMIT
ncbi:hypothetical protein PsorP6_016341 [Peronosclerospora sorghi]|uniref:Uncharacterized protein n=1 Tax=Peronosclerospora sorghi TaxID=230839 RepID=A0ACC0VLJ2_9STRA|nr:hypothetical protein PsorP6_016341 [Peronosclerospora sorghi]